MCQRVHNESTLLCHCSGIITLLVFNNNVYIFNPLYSDILLHTSSISLNVLLMCMSTRLK